MNFLSSIFLGEVRNNRGENNNRLRVQGSKVQSSAIVDLPHKSEQYIIVLNHSIRKQALPFPILNAYKARRRLLNITKMLLKILV